MTVPEKGWEFHPRRELRRIKTSLWKEELGEDTLDRESKLLEGLQSKRDQYICFVRGVSSDTREIALRCRGDVISVEVRGIDGESARM